MAGLANGSRFPELQVSKVGGGVLALPEDLAGSAGVVLAYRGLWCARCNAQLAKYQRHLRELAGVGIRVAAFSADSEQDAAETVRRHGLEFPVGFGVDIDYVAKLLDAYINEDQEHRSLESTNFVLRPDGAIEVALYSSSSIGRLMPDEVQDIVERRRSRWG